MSMNVEELVNKLNSIPIVEVDGDGEELYYVMIDNTATNRLKLYEIFDEAWAYIGSPLQRDYQREFKKFLKEQQEEFDGDSIDASAFVYNMLPEALSTSLGINKVPEWAVMYFL